MSAPIPTTPRIGLLDTDVPDVDSSRASFSRLRALVCPSLIEGAFLAKLMALCDRGKFVSEKVDGLGHREIEHPRIAGTALALALSRPPLFRWLESVTGCGEIAGVDGQVVQTYPRAGDELVWHDDMGSADIRRLGVTIAMGSGEFEGGVFELRRRPGRPPYFSFKHGAPGTGLIFEVSPRLEHRVRPLTAGGPRRIFTGWFIG